jgi:hypothetical protein
MTTTYYCPGGFQPHPSIPSQCVVNCPQEKGYDLRLNGNQARCIYYNDPKIFVDLKSAYAVSISSNRANPPTLDNLKTGNWFEKYLYTLFEGAKSDFDKKFALVDANVDKDRKLRDAFQKLQLAENARDRSPEAYQEARLQYYTLLKGDTWANEEKQRIAAAEVNPQVQKIADVYSDINSRIQQQSNTIQIVDGVKDKLGSLRDEFQYSVGTFGKQIQELKNQIQIERKKREEEKVIPTDWLGTLLNILILLVLGYAIFVVFKKFIRPKPITPNPYR